MTLRAGIIAAGRGDRLRGDAQTLKPLVRVGGRTLVEHVLESLGEAGPAEVAIIINDASTAVRDHVSARHWPFALRWIVETRRLIDAAFAHRRNAGGEWRSGAVLISTVDTVAPKGAYARFMADARRPGVQDADVTLALTPPASDDDTPLLVALDPRDGRTVRALGDGAGQSGLATAGYYAVRPSILREADAARRDEVSALRVFLGRLLARGYKIDGVRAPDSIDVDRPLDVDAAEAFLRRVSL